MTVAGLASTDVVPAFSKRVFATEWRKRKKRKKFIGGMTCKKESVQTSGLSLGNRRLPHSRGAPTTGHNLNQKRRTMQ